MEMKSCSLTMFAGMAALCCAASGSLSLDGSWDFRFEEGKHLPGGAFVGDEGAVLLEAQAGDDGLGLAFA